MDQIRALNDSTGSDIAHILQPTFKIIAPLLLKNKEVIISIPRKTESYGHHPRQKLDIYLSTQNPKTSPILVYFYGGGLVRGDKIVPTVPDGLLYHNLGTFFAKRGITTIIPDYRRVNSETGGEDAVFPSGGEDVSLVMRWLENFKDKGNGDVTIMANSAGGVHLSNFLLDPQFLEQRKGLATGEKGIVFKGGIQLGVPFHFKYSDPGRAEVLKAYYGSAKEIEEKCPWGQLQTCGKTGLSRAEMYVPKVLLLLGEFDPDDEIGQPMRDFAETWNRVWDSGMDFRTIKGHNHISPPGILMSGDVEGEKWGEDVAEWIKSLSS